jgi:hypothetical protein
MYYTYFIRMANLILYTNHPHQFCTFVVQIMAHRRQRYELVLLSRTRRMELVETLSLLRPREQILRLNV